jgi:hypothetical protein
LLNKYKEKFDFLYHRFEQNLGGSSLTKQWERCIDMMGEEEWVMILGDDDYLGENVVEQFYSHLQEFLGKTNVVRFSSRTIVQEENYKASICINPVWESATDAFYRKFKKITRSSLSEYVFSKKAYEKHDFYDYPLAWNSDDRAWLDFSENKPIYSINEALVCVRLSNLNITGKDDNFEFKNKSSVAFYDFLVKTKLKHYDKYKRIELIRKYHFEIKKVRSLNFGDMVFLIKSYLLNVNKATIAKILKRSRFKSVKCNS